MTVGGSTKGNETTAATASFQNALERANHQAIGVPTTRSNTVEIVASSRVKRIGGQSSENDSMSFCQSAAVPYPNDWMMRVASGLLRKARKANAASACSPVFRSTASC